MYIYICPWLDISNHVHLYLPYDKNGEIVPIVGVKIENGKISPDYVKSGLVPEHFPEDKVSVALLGYVHSLQTQLILQLNASSNIVSNGGKIGGELKNLASKMSLAITVRFKK